MVPKVVHGTEERSIRRTLNPDDCSLSSTQAIPVGFIINGLVSNARKHAFPEGNPGDITIQLDRGGATQITIVVRDDGIGFAEHVDFRNSPSLGLTVVNSLVT